MERNYSISDSFSNSKEKDSEMKERFEPGEQWNSPNIKIEPIDDNRIYFNSVTGSVVPEGQNEEDMYEIDSDDQRELEENQIDQYTDVSDKDKMFYKIWNRFIKDK